MKNRFYHADFPKQTFAFSAVLFLGLGVAGFAQTPPPLPPLGALPDIAGGAALPSPVSAAGGVSAPAKNSGEAGKGLAPLPPADAPLADMAPPLPAEVKSLAALPAAGAAQDAAHGAPVDALPPLADLPMPGQESAAAPAAPVKSERADPKKKKDDAEVPPMLALPALPIPQMSSPEPQAAPSVPALPEEALSPAMPEVVVEKKQKSWQTVLAPTSTPVDTNFNYRRQLLPATIYRAEYDNENLHLPKAVSRQDYEGLLFLSVTRNDVETTRALLNAGTNINAVNGDGLTPRAAAHLAGAGATEQLLLARGGR